ncbi:MAG TPA: hypothetical protein V6C91_03780 [Coleofasciculaceae cyanobacterium]
MPERGGRYYAVCTGSKAYSTQALQALRIQQLEQEIAVLKQRNADLLACLDEAVAYIHRLKPKVSARIVAEIAQLKLKGHDIVVPLPSCKDKTKRY